MTVHIPAIEIVHLVMKLRNNSVFLHVSRILILTLIALSAIGHAGEWAKGLDPSMPGCTIPKWGCYQGRPLNMVEGVAELGMPERLLFLPVIDLCAAFLLALKPARTYLVLLVLSFIAFFIQILGTNPVPYTNVLSGEGFWLSQISLLLLSFLSMPLAFVEQMELHPNWEYWKYLPGYMTS